ncbi:MAG: DoxX family protein [Ferruginibacter sp.]
MKKTKIIYWIFTSLFAILMAMSAIPDILSSPIAVKGMHEDLGYPLYFIPFIGVAKVLGVITILIPGYPRIKEWAYAGLVFDLLGATYSIIASGQPAGSWIFMALPLLLAAGSYIFYHKKLKGIQSKSNSSAYESPLHHGSTVNAGQANLAG